MTRPKAYRPHEADVGRIADPAGVSQPQHLCFSTSVFFAHILLRDGRTDGDRAVIEIKIAGIFCALGLGRRGIGRIPTGHPR